MHALWVVCFTFQIIIFLTSGENLYVNMKEKPLIQSYADCITYELLEAQARNISLMQIQQGCNELFLDQMETWTRNIKEGSVTNYISNLLRGVHSGIMENKRRKRRSIFNGGVQYRKEIREPPYDATWGCFQRGIHRLKHSYVSLQSLVQMKHIPSNLLFFIQVLHCHCVQI